MSSFILDSDAGFAVQTNQLFGNIRNYITPLGISAPKVAGLYRSVVFQTLIGTYVSNSITTIVSGQYFQ